ncbi:MAG TPA: alpha/beta hydrolase [Spirochaetia bacterium]|nr:alpha/beta hydrolase [Spirochaetia bacterium]
MKYRYLLFSIFMICLLGSCPKDNPEAPRIEGMKSILGVPYRTIDNQEIVLDLFLPETDTPTPVIIWIHGGGFTHNSRKSIFFDPAFVTGYGYAFISIDYRLAPDYYFPEQVYDCKAAVRWVKAHAAEYNLLPGKIGLWGDSAGGYLVSFLGTSGDVTELEGPHDNPGFDSRVQAVCDFYGVIEPIGNLMGPEGSRNPELKKAANPLTHISPNDPPFLIMHGKKDRWVPYSQSELLYENLKKKGVHAELKLLEDADHGHISVLDFYSYENMERVISFFDRYLK